MRFVAKFRDLAAHGMPRMAQYYDDNYRYCRSDTKMPSPSVVVSPCKNIMRTQKGESHDNAIGSTLIQSSTQNRISMWGTQLHIETNACVVLYLINRGEFWISLLRRLLIAQVMHMGCLELGCTKVGEERRESADYSSIEQ
nr:hypothetical protein Iba_chr14fCG3390 [Ipomoea batatas]